MSTSKTIFDINDLVVWTDDDVDPPVERRGHITVILAAQMLVRCTDGRERFVMNTNRTLRLAGEAA